MSSSLTDRRYRVQARDEILPRTAEGRLRPLIDSMMPLADGAKAHRRMEDRDAMGKIVLVPKGDESNGTSF